ncbi:hypothetical protein Moror_9789 [Moniliophthora roreri MCA 2997]|uniref:Uncharacterized protein n=1 Tax=Moniliophthora roreri (strain MCA 2997) TaxID=1381753 RepID=V2X1A0_MONRO|nr:hypothetical protein Moror_9789 [Moniliophthora roreri MCA 2997]KAI3604436.1 hypothetical protein WG66_008354 [Moniliophthora roreri]
MSYSNSLASFSQFFSPSIGECFAAEVSVHTVLANLLGISSKGPVTVIDRKGPRPIIIIGQSKSSQEYDACAMATFNGQRFKKLENLLQRFLVQVVTKSDQVINTQYSLDSEPRWVCEDPQYILAVPIKLKPENLSRRWCSHATDQSGNRIPFRFSSEKIDILNDIIEDLRIAWLKEILVPGRRDEFIKTYYHMTRKSLKSYISSKSSPSKMSTPSRRDSGIQVAQSPLNPSIPVPDPWHLVEHKGRKVQLNASRLFVILHIDR